MPERTLLLTHAAGSPQTGIYLSIPDRGGSHQSLVRLAGGGVRQSSGRTET